MPAMWVEDIKFYILTGTFEVIIKVVVVHHKYHYSGKNIRYL